MNAHLAALRERAFAIAAVDGSAAKSLKGVIAYIRARGLSLEHDPLNPDDAPWTPRNGRFSAEERELRRARKDVRFRRAYVRRLVGRMGELAAVATTEAEAEHFACAERLASLPGRRVAPPARRVALLPARSEHITKLLGLKGRGEVRAVPAWTSKKIVTHREWKWHPKSSPSRPRQLTTRYARTMHHVICYGQILADGRLSWTIGTLNGVVRAPRGTCWTVVNDAIELVTSSGEQIPFVRDLTLLADESELLPPDLRGERFGHIEFGPSELCAASVAEKRAILAREKHEEKTRDPKGYRDRRAVALLMRSKRLTANYDDARRIGYCPTGIQGWADARGIDPNGTVPLRLLARDADSRAVAVAQSVAERLWTFHLCAKKEGRRVRVLYSDLALA